MKRDVAFAGRMRHGVRARREFIVRRARRCIACRLGPPSTQPSAVSPHLTHAVRCRLDSSAPTYPSPRFCSPCVTFLYCAAGLYVCGMVHFVATFSFLVYRPDTLLPPARVPFTTHARRVGTSAPCCYRALPAYTLPTPPQFPTHHTTSCCCLAGDVAMCLTGFQTTTTQPAYFFFTRAPHLPHTPALRRAGTSSHMPSLPTRIQLYYSSYPLSRFSSRPQTVQALSGNQWWLFARFHSGCAGGR